MLPLKLDHIIHYVQKLPDFKFPGNLLKIHPGGKHEQLGTFNRLVYVENAYLELLDVYKTEQLQKIVKTEEGRVTFPSQIVQDHFHQGFKSIAFQTDDIDQVKADLESRNVEVIGPVNMERVNKKGEKIKWRLLYLADPDYRVKPPFFIQWNEPNDVREQQLSQLRQPNFKIRMIGINSSERAHTVAKWQTWFDMQVVEENEQYTDLKLNNDDIIFRIFVADHSGYQTVVLQDTSATDPYTINIRGAQYRFEV
ncbi:glyoxalase-like protein [Staphylococcus auricularis]|nr:VOC family protein [Staphylococcus auricularis]